MSSATVDIFLAHATADVEIAERLFDLLLPSVRVWLATRCVEPGGDWSVEIPRFQRASLLSAIVVSSRVDPAFYLREEIAAAIALQRITSGKHRVVPVYVDGCPVDAMRIPYGLRALQSIDAVSAGGLAGVAQRLCEFVTRLRDGSAVAAPILEPPPTSAPPHLDLVALYEVLCRLNLGGQFDAVILRAGLPRHQIAPATLPLAQRALDVVQIVEAAGSSLGAKVVAAIGREAPWLKEALVSLGAAARY